MFDESPKHVTPLIRDSNPLSSTTDISGQTLGRAFDFFALGPDRGDGFSGESFLRSLLSSSRQWTSEQEMFTLLFNTTGFGKIVPLGEKINPGANPTIVSYNATFVKIYYDTSSLVCSENKNMFFYLF
jgi:hypothetical protein